MYHSGQEVKNNPHIYLSLPVGHLSLIPWLCLDPPLGLAPTPINPQGNLPSCRAGPTIQTRSGRAVCPPTHARRPELCTLVMDQRTVATMGFGGMTGHDFQDNVRLQVPQATRWRRPPERNHNGLRQGTENPHPNAIISALRSSLHLHDPVYRSHTHAECL